MKKSKSYLLTGIDVDLWKEFKAACAHYNISMKATLTKHIENIVDSHKNVLINRTFEAEQRRKRGK